jgi:hypothetical protein
MHKKNKNIAGEIMRGYNEILQGQVSCQAVKLLLQKQKDCENLKVLIEEQKGHIQKLFNTLK